MQLHDEGLGKQSMDLISAAEIQALFPVILADVRAGVARDAAKTFWLRVCCRRCVSAFD
jgi:hypothetical protein